MPATQQQHGTRFADSLLRVFAATTVGFQYLHGDFGTNTATLGVPSQLQIVAKQHITTDTFMGRVTVPFEAPADVAALGRYVFGFPAR